MSVPEHDARLNTIESEVLFLEKRVSDLDEHVLQLSTEMTAMRRAIESLRLVLERHREDRKD